MEKPRASLIPLALAAASLIAPSNSEGQATGAMIILNAERARLNAYLEDTTRYVRGGIQRRCLAITSSYLEEPSEINTGISLYDPVEAMRDVRIDEERYDCAYRVTQAIDRRLGERRNIEVELFCGSRDWAEDRSKCTISVRSPRRNFNSGHR